MSWKSFATLFVVLFMTSPSLAVPASSVNGIWEGSIEIPTSGWDEAGVGRCSYSSRVSIFLNILYWPGGSDVGGIYRYSNRNRVTRQSFVDAACPTHSNSSERSLSCPINPSADVRRLNCRLIDRSGRSQNQVINRTIEFIDDRTAIFYWQSGNGNEYEIVLTK